MTSLECICKRLRHMLQTQSGKAEAYQGVCSETWRVMDCERAALPCLEGLAIEADDHQAFQCLLNAGR